VLPPARQGDVWRAVQAHRPVAVGLIDGVFLHEPAIWHREILWALCQGVHVFGAASMGALRAAELLPFGMRGVGRVFEAFRDGVWPGFADAFEDDDEVAVVHAPAELGAAPLSDAMVDLRDTLLAAEAAGLLGREARDGLVAALKALPFAERSFRALAALAGTLLTEAQASRFRIWLPTGQAARKREDAEAMLRELAVFLSADPPPFAAAFRFEHVQAWDDFVRAEAPPPAADEAQVLEELQLRPDAWQEAARAALGRLLATEAGAPAEPTAQRAFDAFRTARGLARRADLDAWLIENAITQAGLARLLRDDAALADVVASAPAGLDRAIVDHLRLTGGFAPLLRRARAKEIALAAAPPPSAPELDGALAWFAERYAVDLGALRNDDALATAVWREYVFQRRVQ
jgi:hypothetical protein